MATHCSILAWSIPWTEEPCGLQSVGLQKSSGKLIQWTEPSREIEDMFLIPHSLWRDASRSVQEDDAVRAALGPELLIVVI